MGTIVKQLRLEATTVGKQLRLEATTVGLLWHIVHHIICQTKLQLNQNTNILFLIYR